MTALLLSIGAIDVGAWLYLLLLHGGFWSVRENLATVRDGDTGTASATSAQAPRVVAIVPARNEADVIAQSISSLLVQQQVERVILIDDHSGDATSLAALQGAEGAAAADRLAAILGDDLPPGWSGKLWAMQQGVRRALTFAPDYLLFTDADIVHTPGSVATLVAIAEEHDRDMVSFMAKLHCRAAIEKLLIPAFVFFFFKLYPPRWIAEPRHATAGAAGGCILITPEALARAGGLDAIRGEIIDDCALARAVKRSGGSVELRLATCVSSVRPYSASDIMHMISRSAFSQLRHSTLLLVGAIAGLALLYVAPVVLVASGVPAAAALGACAWLLMTAAYLPMVRFYGSNGGSNGLWALSLPLAALFYMAATVHSAISYWTGRGGRWKGRVQDPATKNSGRTRKQTV